MINESAFDKYTDVYDNWFDENKQIYQAEIKALQRFIPNVGLGIEIGVGTARFAIPLGIRIGIEPSRNMAKIARQRDIATCQGVGEFLPFCNGQFDFALLVTVVCFVDNVAQFFHEVSRVIKTDGKIIVGFIDKNSDLGKIYESRKDSDKFYKHANFYSVSDIQTHLQHAGFCNFGFSQTIFGLSQDAKTYEVLNGYNKGAFVTICATKK
jgi:SAM-dependent methyltransferase